MRPQLPVLIPWPLALIAGLLPALGVTEWWLGIGFTLYFVVLALLWRRTGFALHAGSARD